jgi:hypothetical protein
MSSLDLHLKNPVFDHFRGVTKMISDHSLVSITIGKRGE